MGITEAVLKVDGTIPDSRDELIVSIMMGHRAGREDFPRVVGIGSREQVEAFAWETNLATKIVHRREGGERALGQANSGRISCPCQRCIWWGGGRCQELLMNGSHLSLEEV